MDILYLLNQAKSGSRKAERELFEHFSGPMMLLCYRYTRTREDAEEIMLDGFCKFFKSLRSFHYQNDAMFFGFLKKIMINECLMYLRKKNVFILVSECEAEDIIHDTDHLNNLSANEILDLILQLPVGYRTVFNLAVIEGMEHNEIAHLLGISTGTSKSQLSKAKTLLQKMIAKKGIEYAKQRTV